MRLVKVLFLFSFVLLACVLGLGIYKKSQVKKNTHLQLEEIVIPKEPELDVILLEDENEDLSAVDQWPIQDVIEDEDVDRVSDFFNARTVNNSPFVQSITYQPSVTWLPERSAWLADYAAHFRTSKHFISRSLSYPKIEYYLQNIKTGDRFNVLRNDPPIEFHLVVDLSRCKMRFYVHEPYSKSYTLLKTYRVGVGKLDVNSQSNCNTPLGTFKLGSRVAVYKPGTMGIYRGKETEMMKIFGTRWIPFETDEKSSSPRVKGIGLHGVPWSFESNRWIEAVNTIGCYVSDGCVRMESKDIEEIFSIVITRPTTIEIVRDFKLSSYISKPAP